MKEAKVLLDSNCPEGAYYLAGYAAECALKACIAKQTGRHEFPDKKRVQDSHTHDLGKLAELAGLATALSEAEKLNPALYLRWKIVRNWSERSRYGRPSHAEAEELLAALNDRRQGVLRWLRRFW
jgi:HEPN domain-containing protein